MTNDPREALQDAAAAQAEDMAAFQVANESALEDIDDDEEERDYDDTIETNGDEAVCCVCEFVHCECDEFEDDGQPTEYEEYQDLYGGDDWDQGQYDDDGW